MIRTLAALLATLALGTSLAFASAPTPPTLKPSASPSAKGSAAPSGSPSAEPTSESSLAPVAIPSGGTQMKVGVWNVYTASADVNWKSGDFSVPSHLLMTRVGGDINSDRASGNYKTQGTKLYGHVVMHDSNGNFGGLSSTKTESSSSRGPSTLTADEVDIQGKAKTYTAIGNVHYVQNDTTVDSETGKLNDITHELDLDGNVRIVQGTRSMNAEHVTYNTISGQAHGEGNVVMQFPSAVNPHFATPKPIHVRNILQKPKPQPT